jgi:hypothetical protein
MKHRKLKDADGGRAFQGTLDGQLYLIKHLLLLRELLASYGVNFVHSEKLLDFSSLTSKLESCGQRSAEEYLRHSVDTMSGLLSKGGSLFQSTGLLNLVQLGIPTLKEQRIDAKKVYATIFLVGGSIQ